MDLQVLHVQQWLNSEYSKVDGFKPVPEDGKTGWNTIYGLREGLQHELGINPVSSGFGDKTKEALGKVVGQLKVGYKGKIAKLIQGAFWCKGISPLTFNEDFSDDTQAAVNTMRNDAGLSNGGLSVPLMGGLFDMTAFVLLNGGTNKVRGMQQYLNRNYLEYFGNDLGLVPTDGLYQRNTNTALIYALQAIEGYSPSQANGIYGPGTIAKTPTVNPGASGSIVKLIQYGLMVNGFFDGNVNGQYGSDVSSAVVSFRKFMNLPPFTGTSDLTVIKGLLTSNGNTNRDSDACDTSFQLNDHDVQVLKKYGFKLVGRYLTGTVGVGAKKRDKNLTNQEISSIVKGGLKVFPIYQDNDGSQEYFNYGQGHIDAHKAIKAADNLGFPKGSIIYFAVDTDVQDGDIAGTVIPYFQGVTQVLNSSRYQAGVYGTRNVCTRAINSGGVADAFVSDMSTGYSGNLGYRMPTKWLIDQFTEYQLGDIAIDQDASSGRDNGVNKFSPVKTQSTSAQDTLNDIMGNTKLEVDGPKISVPVGDSFTATLQAKSTIKSSNSSGIFTISNGKLPTVDIASWLEKDFHLDIASSDYIISLFNGQWKFIQSIDSGDMEVIISSNSDGITFNIGFKFNVYKVIKGKQNFNTELSIILMINMKTGAMPGMSSVMKQFDYIVESNFVPYASLGICIGIISVIGLFVSLPADIIAIISEVVQTVIPGFAVASGYVS